MNGTMISDSTKPNFFTLTPDESGSIMQSMISSIERVLDVQDNFNIAATDYTTYAIAYSSESTNWYSKAWLITRARNLDQSTYNLLYQYASNIGISTSKFQQTNQVGCTN
jgi:hypothetical protein